ncbi:MAG: DNA repair protein RadA [Microthrixaceae bacterium]
MSKARATAPKSVHRCSTCGAEHPKWSGQCGGCGEWNTLDEVRVARAGSIASMSPAIDVRESSPVPITELVDEPTTAVATGMEELDRVLGGGLVPGSVTLLGGEPGVGKSTVVLQLLAAQATGGARCLYVTGEESPAQVASRAKRLDALSDELFLLAEASLPKILSVLAEQRPSLCVVDSIQTMTDPGSPSAAGSVTQVRGCANLLVSAAKTLGVTVVLVGHVTKEGSLAGPRVLEHVVDTVLHLEGDRQGELRVLRTLKHRFGSTQEIGLFSMGPGGLESVADPSALFLADRRAGLPGSVVLPAIEGRRPILVELQALTNKRQLAHPRRSTQGLDGGRLELLMAVLQRQEQINTTDLDVYALVVGGVKVTEPGADLAICAAIMSSVYGQPCPADVVLCGEVGLGGELRRVGMMPQRLNEAARHGFTRALVPSSSAVEHAEIDVVNVSNLHSAMAELGLY